MKKYKFGKFEKRIKKGDYLADYFLKTTEIVKKFKPKETVTMQFFQRKEHTVLCGIEQSVDLIRYAAKNYKDLTVWALEDGNIVEPLEPVMKITGRYQDFGFLEGMIDGILARASSVATNSKNVIDLVGSDKAINMVDRADLYINQPYDGYASYIGGFRNFVSKAALDFINDPAVPTPSGTMPHSLIQIYNGDIIAATKAFAEAFPDSPLVSLVDYNNDCVTDAVAVAKALPQLSAVRIDTAGNMMDKYLEKNKSKYPKGTDLYGVNPYLVKAVREALDKEGFNKVRIIVSSGFNPDKIAKFEKAKTPVDVYGVGEYLARINVNFTGDCVSLNGQPQAKAGRKEIISNRLLKIEW